MRVALDGVEQMSGPNGWLRGIFEQLVGSIAAVVDKEHKSDGAHKAITADSVAIAGATTLGAPLLTGASVELTPPQIVAATNDYAPAGLGTAQALRLSTDASRNLSGIAITDPSTRRWLLLMNVGSQDLVLLHDSTSTARYRFYCPGSGNFTLSANDSAWVRYDPTSQRWRVIGV